MNIELSELEERLKDHVPQSLPQASLIPAAILVPIVWSDRPYLTYTLRSDLLKHHGGQVSFPGGRIEDDEDPWTAALREAHEEIGLNPEDVSFLGRLDDVYSPRGFHIRCYVGRVDLLQPVVNEDEVQALLRVNLEELFDKSRHEVRPWQRDRRIPVHHFSFSAGVVWGVTGVITYHLRSTLAPEMEDGLSRQVRHPWWDEKARRFRWPEGFPLESGKKF